MQYLENGRKFSFFIPGIDCEGAREGAGVEHYILVSEYGKNGADAEIVVFKKR
ncbi:hypothetical protein [Fibrobacter sp. UWCM]|uniref:hypothetical protein n=1 Tax=Fibrobacter sp. UWCM TaxID=1896208 RepID=UPI001587F773|nr:hypothetical protein [Fibrobacter sp. UWCM]